MPRVQRIGHYESVSRRDWSEKKRKRQSKKKTERLTRVAGNPEKPNVKFSTELKGHQAGIEKVAFNPTKDAELCSLSSDGVVRFWDVRTKACFNEVTGLGDAMTLVWAPDGQTLLVGNRVCPHLFSHHVDHACSGMAHRFQSDNIFVLSPTQSTPLASHQQTVQTNQIAFCWSGKKIFVTTSEGQIRILSYPEFEPVLRLGDGDDAAEFTLKGHTASCLTAELQPMGRYLATGGANSIIALWDTTDWLCQRTITRMTGPVRSISELSPKAVAVLDGAHWKLTTMRPRRFHI